MLSRAAFESCWYQLADLNTIRVDDDDYAAWIREVIGRLTKEAKVPAGGAQKQEQLRQQAQRQRHPQQQQRRQAQRQRQAQQPSSQRVWRSDSELISELCEACVREGIAPSSAITQQV